MQKLPKIMVRVKTLAGELFFIRRVLPDGKSVLVEKESKRKKRDAWKVTFSQKSLYPIKRYGLKKMMCIDVVKDAPKAIDYNYDQKKANIPLYDRETERERITAGIIKEYGEKPQYQTGPLIYLILGFAAIGALGVLYLLYRLLA